MVNVATDTLLIHCKSLHGRLHAVKARRLPHKINGKVMRTFNRNLVVVAWQLQRNFVADIYVKQRRIFNMDR